MSSVTTPAVEVVEPLSLADAQKIDGHLRHEIKIVNAYMGHLHDALHQLRYWVDRAKRGDIHTTLGYASWPAYIEDAFKVRGLPAKKRKELVWFLSDEGLSERVIGNVVGVDQKTVSNDLRGEENSSPETTGRDGKTYKRKPPKPPKPAAVPTFSGEPLDVIRDLLNVTLEHLDQMCPASRHELVQLIKESADVFALKALQLQVAERAQQP
jgi:hypothetical protein